MGGGGGRRRLYFRADGGAGHLPCPVPLFLDAPLPLPLSRSSHGAPPRLSAAPRMADAGLPGPAASAGADPAADEFRDIIRSRSGRRPPSALLPLSPAGSVSAWGDRGLNGERGRVRAGFFLMIFFLFSFFLY